MTLDGKVTTLATFGTLESGRLAPLIQAQDGNFYGTTGSTVQKLTPEGVVTILAAAPNDGSISRVPNGTLVEGAPGTFYGVYSGSSYVRGYANYGSVARISAEGELTTLYSFDGVHGKYPVDGLVKAPDGEFVGVTQYGGAQNAGTVFRVTSAGAITSLYSFPGVLGSFSSSLLQAPDGSFYGTSVQSAPGDSAIFRLLSNGDTQRVAASDTPENPISALVIGPDGNFYGTTDHGGANNQGTIFRLNAGGDLQTIVSFNGANGSRPIARLALGSDGNFYGTTFYGGGAGSGTAFRVTSAGVLTTLASFDATTGDYPTSPLLQASDGNFYGTTTTGAAGNLGSVFRLTSGGDLTVLAVFTGANGADPEAGLIEAKDGNFYGTTVSGGANASGTIFRITPGGTLTTVASFPAQPYGVMSGLGFPHAALLQARDGNFYGTASGGGGVRNAIGGVFELTSNGDFITLQKFDYATGTSYSELILATEGALYGTTSATVFRLSVLPLAISAVFPGDNQIVIEGNNFSGTTAVSVGGTPVASFVVDSPFQITAKLTGADNYGLVSVTSPLGTATFEQQPSQSGPALNISTRVNVGTGDDALIGGFIVQGSAAKKVIIRAIGPSLAAAGVSGVLQNPVLELHDSSGDIIAANDDWQSSADKQAIIDTGIPPLDPQEAAIVRALEPGNYTAVVRGSGDKTGVGLVEVYDLDRASGKLANISTRGSVQSGNNVMIGGFIIGGDAPGKVLVRAIGPSLANANPPISGALSDPQLELRDADGNLMATNDNWQEGAQTQQISDTTLAPSDPKEAAILASLNPGNYTAIVSGVNNSAGIALVEVYKLD
jgi:uncharacterized repeat protein (TIGR03803 family)